MMQYWLTLRHPLRLSLVDSLPPTETVADAILVDTPPKNPPTKTADSLFPNKMVHSATA